MLLTLTSIDEYANFCLYWKKFISSYHFACYEFFPCSVLLCFYCATSPRCCWLPGVLDGDWTWFPAIYISAMPMGTCPPFNVPRFDWYTIYAMWVELVGNWKITLNCLGWPAFRITPIHPIWLELMGLKLTDGGQNK